MEVQVNSLPRIFSFSIRKFPALDQVKTHGRDRVAADRQVAHTQPAAGGAFYDKTYVLNCLHISGKVWYSSKRHILSRKTRF